MYPHQKPTLPLGTSVAIFWFRRDLRYTDNAGLYHALQSGVAVLPLFIFDTEILSLVEDKCDRRVDFIHQALQGLHQQFVGYKSSLLCAYGRPEEIFAQLLLDYSVTAVYCNEDYEPYAKQRDNAIQALLGSNGIPFYHHTDQVMCDYRQILKKDGSPYMVFTPYALQWKKQVHAKGIPSFPSEERLNNLVSFSSPFPPLKEIGFLKTDITYHTPVVDISTIQTYHETRNYPALDKTSKLSVHLRFGTYSVRKALQLALVHNDTWANEFIWREFFMMILSYYPHVVNHCFKPAYERILWRNKEDEFALWCQGKTGYPLVDAGMRELNATGLMHNRVRMITASFLCKHLLIDWRWGEAYFAKKLFDYDLSANNGNWQWAAGTGVDAAPYFRVFNPQEQWKKFDTQAIYIKKWVPEYQASTYKEMVNHSFARERALKTYKQGLSSL